MKRFWTTSAVFGWICTHGMHIYRPSIAACYFDDYFVISGSSKKNTCQNLISSVNISVYMLQTLHMAEAIGLQKVSFSSN